MEKYKHTLMLKVELSFCLSRDSDRERPVRDKYTVNLQYQCYDYLPQ